MTAESRLAQARIPPEELDVIQAIADAATPGPWKFAAWGDEGNHAFDVHVGAYRVAWDLLRDDAAFIAAARGFVPNLVAEVRRLQSAVAAAQKPVVEDTP